MHYLIKDTDFEKILKFLLALQFLLEDKSLIFLEVNIL